MLKVSKLIAEIRELNEGKLQILAKKKRNMVNLSFCKQQAKRNEPGFNPLLSEEGGP